MDRRRFLAYTAGEAAGATLASTVSGLAPLRHGPAAASTRQEIPATCEMCVNECSIIAVVERKPLISSLPARKALSHTERIQ